MFDRDIVELMQGTHETQVLIWSIVLLCSIRGFYNNVKTRDWAWATAFGVLIPASIYLLLDLFGMMPEDFMHFVW